MLSQGKAYLTGSFAVFLAFLMLMAGFSQANPQEQQSPDGFGYGFGGPWGLGGFGGYPFGIGGFPGGFGGFGVGYPWGWGRGFCCGRRWF